MREHRIRWRRLAPVVLFGYAFAIALLVGCSESVPVQSVTLRVFLVRHAEPEDVPGNEDPGLSEAGRQRAAALRDKLRDAEITAIFTSPFLRTQESAAPIAEELAVSPRRIGFVRGINQHIADLATAVRNHRGTAVLVVGHGDTVPAVIRRLGGPALKDLCETTFDVLFTVELKGGAAQLTPGRYGDPSPPPGPNCM